MNEKRSRMPDRFSAASRRRIRLAVVVAAVAVGGWQIAHTDWSQARQTLDHTLWSHALQDRPAPTDLTSAAPVWREREGASGDRIVERVDGQSSAETAMAILSDVSGKAVSGHLLAQPGAHFRESEKLRVEPAALDGLSAGDRLTITTTDGRIYTFEIGAPADESVTNGMKITIRFATSDDGKTALHDVTPITPHSGASQSPQQEL